MVGWLVDGLPGWAGGLVGWLVCVRLVGRDWVEAEGGKEVPKNTKVKAGKG